MNLSLIWRRVNLRWCCLVPENGWICFKAVKSSYRSMILPSTPLHVINTSACIWTRHLILKHIFKKCTRRQQEEWTSYGASVPALILLVPNEFINRWLCQYLRIAAIIVLDGQSPANAWSAPPRNHFPKMQFKELWSSIFNNWQLFTKESVLLCIWLS